MQQHNTNSGKRRNIFPAIFLLIAACIIYLMWCLWGSNTGAMPGGNYFYIHTGDSYTQVEQNLVDGGFIKSQFTFKLLAGMAKYPAHVHPGKYKIDAGMSNNSIVRMLRNGHQVPVRLVINKLRTKQDFAQLISRNLENDSLKVMQLLSDATFAKSLQLDTTTLMCAVMPDTYEFYWNTDVAKVMDKIAKSYTHYWTDDRKAAAAKQGLTSTKAIILASIIEEESNKNDEKPFIASTYINRLHKHMPLQADPTLKFAVGNFALRRIGGPLLKVRSPYNTYINTGLPPGPICTPSVASIEAVLHAPATNYLYFCAKPDFSGGHQFTGNYTEQMRNAKAYQKALNDRNIH
jgi:UPF0755 protein